MMEIYGIHDFTLERHGGFGPKNDPLPPTTQQLKGFIETKNELIKDQHGLDVLSKSNIIINQDRTIKNKDIIIYESRRWNIVLIQHPEDFSNKITRLYLK